MSAILPLNFFGSAPFVLPLINEIHINRGRSLQELAKEQLSRLPLSVREELYLYPTLFDHLSLQKTIELSAVITQPDRFNRKKLVRNKIAQFCLEKEIYLFQPQKIKAEVAAFLDIPPADIGIVAAYGQILPREVIEAQPYGLLNWHPSLLPEYRGATPIQAALRNRRTHSGLSWIEVVSKMDAGDIYLQTPYKIKPQDDFETLARYFVNEGVRQWALVVALRILDKERGILDYVPRRQKFADATFCGLLSKEDKYLDPEALSAEEVYAHYRAYKTFPGTVYTSRYFRDQVRLTQALGIVSEQEFERLRQEAKSVGVFREWLQIVAPSGVFTLLKTKQGYLRVLRITLSSGREVVLSGYQF